MLVIIGTTLGFHRTEDMLLIKSFKQFILLLHFSIQFVKTDNVVVELTEAQEITQSSSTDGTGPSPTKLSPEPTTPALTPLNSNELPPTRSVELTRDPEWGLGISIVGGRSDADGEQKLKGIYIKHVLETSPAGKSGLLKTGDQILEVC